MARFSRLFPNIGRLFPPYGEPIIVPNSIGGDVSFTHELYRADVKHQLYLTMTAKNTASGGGGNVVVGGVIPEPQEGYVAWPYAMSVFHPDVATRLVTAGSVLTGNNPLLTTGGWGNTDYVQLLVRQSTWTPLPCPFPVPRGNNVFVTFVGVGAGLNLLTMSFVVQIPVQAFDWQRSPGWFGHTTFNTPI